VTFPHDAPIGTVLPAWDFIGYDGDHYLRVVGGRAKYETAIFFDDTPGTHVRLARIDSTADGLHQVSRWVHPDTPIEVVA
jgi:hypothetical protein